MKRNRWNKIPWVLSSVLALSLFGCGKSTKKPEAIEEEVGREDARVEDPTVPGSDPRNPDVIAPLALGESLRKELRLTYMKGGDNAFLAVVAGVDLFQDDGRFLPTVQIPNSAYRVFKADRTAEEKGALNDGETIPLSELVEENENPQMVLDLLDSDRGAGEILLTPVKGAEDERNLSSAENELNSVSPFSSWRLIVNPEHTTIKEDFLFDRAIEMPAPVFVVKDPAVIEAGRSPGAEDLAMGLVVDLRDEEQKLKIAELWSPGLPQSQAEEGIHRDMQCAIRANLRNQENVGAKLPARPNMRKGAKSGGAESSVNVIIYGVVDLENKSIDLTPVANELNKLPAGKGPAEIFCLAKQEAGIDGAGTGKASKLFKAFLSIEIPGGLTVIKETEIQPEPGPKQPKESPIEEKVEPTESD